MSFEQATLRIKPGEDRRLRQGHAWVFSNEVDVDRTPLSDFAPGQPVLVETSKGKVVGSGFINPNALICARLYSRQPGVVLDHDLIVRRLRAALNLREQLFSEPYYRWVFAESDGLPGLIVDRYNDVLALQLNTAGMQAVESELVSALHELVQPRAILLRNDTSGRVMEGLAQEVRWIEGDSPARVSVREHGTEFEIDIATGQKTGWFYDQRMNRARMRAYVRERRVLDVFSYVGAWGVQAAQAGAAEVICVDSSQPALDQVLVNARRNNVERQVSICAGDAFEVLKTLRNERAKFDVVIVDPPALIKRKKDIIEGTGAYHRLNQLALPLLNDGGVLISCSCSYHLARDALRDVIRTAGQLDGRGMQILEQGHQAPDHPIHPAIPETEYLKGFIARVMG